MSSIGGQSLGRLVRLRALDPAQLPAHPDLAPLQISASALPDIELFITDILNEASSFMTDYIPQHFAIKDRSKTSPPAKATIQLLAHEISAQQLGPGAHDEFWYARTSLHESKKEPGTASWAEFEAGLYDDHSLHESQYTPDVFDAHKVLSWDSKLAEKQHKIGAWEKVGLSSKSNQCSMPRIRLIATVSLRDGASHPAASEQPCFSCPYSDCPLV